MHFFLNLVACGDNSLTVNNTAPGVTIASPAAGAMFAEGEVVTLSVLVDDAQTSIDELKFAVTSTLDGALPGAPELTSDGAIFTLAGLAAGEHSITVVAVDAGGTSGEDSVGFTVVANEAPTVAFIDPAPGEKVGFGSPAHVQVQVADANDESLNAFVIVWGGDAASLVGLPTSPNSDGTADFYFTDLAIGTYSVTTSVTDTFGASGSGSLVFEVAEADGDGDGYVAVELGGADCNDGDASINPGAAEWCNGIDDNCEGQVDEVGSLGGTIGYADTDGDGFGDPAAGVSACADQPGYVTNATDCDDGDASSYPDGVELCLDGADNDCDGTTDNCTLDGADARLIGGGRGDQAAGAIASIGDVDGNGTDDLAIGALGASDGGANAGAIYLVRGPFSGDIDIRTAAGIFVGDVSMHLGFPALAGGGDLTGDGILDLTAAIYSGNYAGDVFVASASATGSVNLVDSASVWFDGSEGSGYYGLCGTHDVTGDGDADLVAGLPTLGGPGWVYVFSGPLTGDLATTDATSRITGATEAGYFGSQVASPGDLDGDGIDDLIVASRQEGTASPSTGAVRIFLGPLTENRTAGDAEGIWSGEQKYDTAGSSLAGIGDVNGDGLPDIGIGAEGEGTTASYAGAAYVLTATNALQIASLSDADAKLLGERAYDSAGGAVSSAGDINRDGTPDILVGAAAADFSAVGSGRTYLVLGPFAGTTALADSDALFDGAEGYDGSGNALLGDLDTDGDGVSDVVIGAYAADAGLGDSGAAYVILGGRI